VPESDLRFTDVVAGYGALTVLRGFTAYIAAGKVTTLVGANGAGKSTVFKAMFGLADLRSGEIRLSGESVARLPAKALLARGVVYVPQGRNLFPTLSVAENLELGGVTLPARVRRGRMEHVWDRFPQLAARRGRQASTLSGGEQKMLEIGRALLLEPKVLLVDEPSIGLSPKLAQEAFATLQSLAHAGVTVMMVEQNVKSGLGASHHAIAMEGGRVALEAPAHEILSHPRIRSVFLGGHVAEVSP
jgi:branched-chain amino acid transport system ATP-binding protein